MDVTAKFEGGRADDHILPALEGSESIAGIARTLTLVSHYVATGTVRKRQPFQSPIRVEITATRPGSFETVFDFFVQPGTAITSTGVGAIATGLIGGAVIELTKLIFRRLTGSPDGVVERKIRDLADEKSGDVEALTEAVQPALLRAHDVINYGAGNIVLISGGNNVIRMTPSTKLHLASKVKDDEVVIRKVSVGMLNANTGNGRVYDYELGRTVSIFVPRGAKPGTMTILAQSLEKYSKQRMWTRDSEIMITATRELSADDLVKRYVVLKAEWL